MAVQDPFVLSHNIALNVNGRTKDLLTAEIQMASSKVFFFNFLFLLFFNMPVLFTGLHDRNKTFILNNCGQSLSYMNPRTCSCFVLFNL